MENGPEGAAKIFARYDPCKEFVFFYIVGDTSVGDIDEFSPIGKVIDHKNVIDP